jgi:hypothetical protein
MNRLKPLLLVMILSLLLAVGCAGESQTVPPVNVAPLYDLEIEQFPFTLAQIFDMRSFNPVEVSDTFIKAQVPDADSSPSSATTVEVHIYLPTETKVSNDFFIFECASTNEMRVTLYHGKDDNRYCISDIKADQNIIGAATGTYTSFVVVQKGRLVVAIWEHSRDPSSQAKDRVIQKLASDVAKLQ